MRFWFIHSGEVSVRERIITQITLGILSEELAPGWRLPSTRELARQFHLQANTVSAAYQQLESEGWVASRRGSGAFVRDHHPTGHAPITSSAQALYHIFTRFLNSARELDIPPICLLKKQCCASVVNAMRMMDSPCDTFIAATIVYRCPLRVVSPSHLLVAARRR
jgi:DNA-binding transcriptional regulator YhcF (GntR family)